MNELSLQNQASRVVFLLSVLFSLIAEMAQWLARLTTEPMVRYYKILSNMTKQWERFQFCWVTCVGFKCFYFKVKLLNRSKNAGYNSLRVTLLLILKSSILLKKLQILDFFFCEVVAERLKFYYKEEFCGLHI